MPSNIELKARCSDLGAARQVALSLGAQPQGVEAQTDTFFVTPRGRLKLRESDLRGAMLIPYLRPDDAAPKQSDYLVLPVADPAAAHRVLGEMLGVAAVVRKRREVLLLGNVRIHLDQVEGLGAFVEFEAVLGEGKTPESERAKVRELMAAFSITEHDLESRAYVDLLTGQMAVHGSAPSGAGEPEHSPRCRGAHS